MEPSAATALVLWSAKAAASAASTCTPSSSMLLSLAPIVGSVALAGGLFGVALACDRYSASKKRKHNAQSEAEAAKARKLDEIHELLRTHSAVQQDVLLETASSVRSIHESVLRGKKPPADVVIMPPPADEQAVTTSGRLPDLQNPPLYSISGSGNNVRPRRNGSTCATLESEQDRAGIDLDSQLMLPYRRFKTPIRIDLPRTTDSLVCFLEDICAVILERQEPASGSVVLLKVLLHGSAVWDTLSTVPVSDIDGLKNQEVVMTRLDGVFRKHKIDTHVETTICLHTIPYLNIATEACGGLTPGGCNGGHVRGLIPYRHIHGLVHLQRQSRTTELVLCGKVRLKLEGIFATERIKRIYDGISRQTKHFAQASQQWPPCVGCGLSSQLSPCVRVFLDNDGQRLALCENCVLNTTLYTLGKINFETHKGPTSEEIQQLLQTMPQQPPPPPPVQQQQVEIDFSSAIMQPQLVPESELSTTAAP